MEVLEHSHPFAQDNNKPNELVLKLAELFTELGSFYQMLSNSLEHYGLARHCKQLQSLSDYAGNELRKFISSNVAIPEEQMQLLDKVTDWHRTNINHITQDTAQNVVLLENSSRSKLISILKDTIRKCPEKDLKFELADISVKLQLQHESISEVL